MNPFLGRRLNVKHCDPKAEIRYDKLRQSLTKDEKIKITFLSVLNGRFTFCDISHRWFLEKQVFHGLILSDIWFYLRYFLTFSAGFPAGIINGVEKEKIKHFIIPFWNILPIIPLHRLYLMVYIKPIPVKNGILPCSSRLILEKLFLVVFCVFCGLYALPT